MFKGIIFAVLISGFSIAGACIETVKVDAQESATASCSYQSGNIGVATLESFVYLGVEETAPQKYVGKFSFFCSNNKGGYGKIDLTYAGNLKTDYQNNTIDENKCILGTVSIDTAEGVKF